MNPSPLQLERHFFTRIHLDAHADGQPGTPNTLKAQLEVGQAVDNPRRFQLTLRLELLPPTEKKPVYTGEIHAVGLFKVVDACPQDKIQKLVEVNGAAILYGAIRELLINLTSRGPWPSVCLHSVTFLQPESATSTEGQILQEQKTSTK